MEKNYKLLAAIEKKFDTQSIFASHLGINASIVSNVINGRYNLTENEKHSWADLLDSTVEYLFGETE